MTAPVFIPRRPTRSLRTTLMFWFLIFSLVPLSLITGYFLKVYQSTIDNEIKERLKSNTRELNQQFVDLNKRIRALALSHVTDPTVAFALSTNNIPTLKKTAIQRINNRNIKRLGYLNRRGQYLVLLQDGSGAPQFDLRAEKMMLSWEESFLKRAITSTIAQSLEIENKTTTIDLITVTRIRDRKGELAGFVENVYVLNRANIEQQARRMNLELVLISPQGQPIISTHADGLGIESETLKNAIHNPKESYFNFPLADVPYGFLVIPIQWGNGKFYLAVGASKFESLAFQRRVMAALFTLVGLLFLAVIISTWIVSARLIVKPLRHLLEATQNLNQSERPTLIPVTSDDEIGVLTASFNDMTNRVYRAQADLQGKIDELQVANVELKDTQARLVHTAKMASLGQLVAGVAHELNNPIGFIYSNMSHLREHADKLMTLIAVAEKNPQELNRKKDEFEYDYIVDDLPRLIKSCEEGARRTRDIVVGLRNFSRLEEAKVKRINIKENIENTLSLLSGDIKNRIRVETHLEDIPDILCFPSQLNQVFMNILSNAVHAIDGEGKITIEGKSVRRGKQNFVSLKIRDTGIGISPDNLEKIFDPFFTTKTVGQGTGLGLSISYGIVRKHGGDITVRSDLGKGTEFTILLPVDGPQDVAI